MVSASLILSSLFLSLLQLTTAAPVAVLVSSFVDNAPRDGTSTAQTLAISNQTVSDALVRPAQFSRVAYCSTATVTNLTCGGPCDALGSNVQILQAGGDDGQIPLYFIANDPDTSTVVVAHQGTDPTNLLSILNDVQIGLTDLNTTRFPSTAGLSLQVHDGFQQTFERTADSILSGVQSALTTTGATNVLVTGHSLGAAIATLDALLLQQNLPAGTNITTSVFGLPRVGNTAFADFVDSVVNQSAGSFTLTHVTNQNDPVPTLPPRFLDFQHPSGEVHIQAVDGSGQVTSIVDCPGQENENCSEGNSLFSASIPNHLGPYFEDISFGQSQC